MSLSNAIAKVLAAALLEELPGELAEEFDLEEEEVQKFLAGWASKQLGVKSVKGKKKGSGKTNSFMLFSNEHREEVKADGAKGGAEIAKTLGAMWKKLDDDEKAEYKEKAKELNESKGLTAAVLKGGKKKAAAPKKDSKKKTVAKKASKKKTVVKKDSKKKTVAKKASSSESSESSSELQEMKVVRDKEHKVWLVKDTKLVVKSNRDHTVVKKLRGDKQIKLSAQDIAKCKKNGWAVQKDETKPAAKKASQKPSKAAAKKISKAKTSESEPEDEAPDTPSASESEPESQVSDAEDSTSESDTVEKARKLLLAAESDESNDDDSDTEKNG